MTKIPIVCTITEVEVPDRLAVLERMRANLTGLERSDRGLVLHFTPTVADDVRQFVVDEKRCCEFWDFEVDGSTLRWAAPPEAAELLDRVHAFFAGDGAPLL